MKENESRIVFVNINNQKFINKEAKRINLLTAYLYKKYKLLIIILLLLD